MLTRTWSGLAVVFVLALALTAAPGCAKKKPLTTPLAEPPVTQQKPPEEAKQPPPEPETIYAPEDVRFDYDKSNIRDDARPALNALGKYLLENPGAMVLIEGHCDERGTTEYNLALGERRAKAARDFLAAYGIGADRISTISYGKERPLDPGQNETAWAKNRRAHFVLKGV
jgi:peptidoglycan-associated lipoprotein